ncbi:general stress protein [Pontibacillus halophilus JSM 076056 = DSM 19796]|uniref:General stress protein n=1 Tax=Pontibacillus halophilus JSM 076056 = DSM 19796 TaxID=1385510 RepID=A0A0A5I724_9BACI|nr:general stress protein [Pontibacillus halophilus]KGX91637.1 general stress protein [Pontibacillus halophilus JSM 076056 = DSM 19796]
MKPFVREYTNDEVLKDDVQKLSNNGIHKDNIYLMTHDDDRTERLADSTDANTVGLNEMNMKEAVGNLFNKKGDELRNKLQDLGFSASEAETYEERLDEGKVLLMVQDSSSVEHILN